jgi:hypothetical protein
MPTASIMHMWLVAAIFFIFQPSSPPFKPLPINFLEHLPVSLNQISNVVVAVVVKFNFEV